MARELAALLRQSLRVDGESLATLAALGAVEAFSTGASGACDRRVEVHSAT
jgi:hypothetical protein